MEKKKSSEVVTRSGLNRKRRRFFLHEKKEANRTQEEDYRSVLVMSRLVSKQHMRSKRFAGTMIVYDLCVPLKVWFGRTYCCYG